MFRNNLILYDELLAPFPTHLFSAVTDYLLSIFITTLHVWGPYPPSAIRGRAMPL